MQPDVVGGFDAVGQQRIVGVFTIAASETAPCRRAFRGRRQAVIYARVSSKEQEKEGFSAKQRLTRSRT
jgi:predicted site-specific integrase-resolvase